ncbi:MAG: gamma carbonic anhydrase family protein [Candidatus Abyssobacteria bacterium SURF_17]|uniref:Gamma carbonic anhydrase family protein n=1 Tax=Candidatus Abyssobacteria bacterium SURF_17 TaxID=2093361 RepID=A0A419EN13_9BACT|nr:MAG: gamma carbonic anhydrase family protein [Candidatus Abyssubacteria bacterium SURF_17]
MSFRNPGKAAKSADKNIYLFSGGILMNIDPSVFIHPSAVLHGNLTIGKHSSIWPNAVIRADFNYITIGRYTNIQDHATIHASPTHPTTVGDFVTAAHSTILHACAIGNRVMIGMGATIMDGAHIGDGTLIAAGALVKEGTIVPSGSLVVGVPGKILEGKGRPEFNEQNAVSYYVLSRKYLEGKDTISPEELVNLMQSFRPEE